VDPSTYREGALGAMMDEYDRAVRELAAIVGPLSQVAFVAVRDRETSDEDCRSIQTVLNHVLRAGYRYVGYLRAALEVPYQAPEFSVDTPLDAILELATLASWTADSFKGRETLPHEALAALKIQSRWGPVYDLEQMMEHAVVHLLRHRRQIERFLAESRFRGDRR
jgi:uncharacterized damage-inducible protein DinB